MESKKKNDKRKYQSLLTQVENIKNKNDEVNRLASKIRKKDRQINTIFKNLEEFKANAETILSEYSKEKRKVKQKLKKAESFYEEWYLPVRKKLMDRGTGLKKTLRDNTKIATDIKLKNEQLKQVHSEYKRNIIAIRSTLRSIRKIEENSIASQTNISKQKKIIENHISDSQGILDNIQKNYEDVKRLNIDISKILKNARREYQEIQNLNTESKNAAKEINDLKLQASATNDKISELYEITTNKTMAGAFDERKKMLATELSKWQKRVFVWSIAWFFAIASILLLQIGFNKWSIADLNYEFYLRFLFTAPIAYYLFFCVAQFNSIRKAHDKYSFKTTIALSIEAHTELLARNFDLKKYESEILQFSLKSLNKVYDEPYFSDREREQLRVRKSEVKGKKNKLPVEQFLSVKNNELYKLLDKALNMVNPKNT